MNSLIKTAIFILMAVLCPAVCLNAQSRSPSYSQAQGRDYYRPMSDREKADIHYIITTISGKSKVSLLFAQSSLNQAGNRVAHVHPLNFLAYVFSDPQLKTAAKRIQGVVWNRFSGDMAESLAKEVSRNNMNEEYLQDFTQKVGIDMSVIAPAAQQNRWQDFINIVRNNVR